MSYIKCTNIIIRILILTMLIVAVLGVDHAYADSSLGLYWAKRMGGTSYDESRAIAVDGNGNAYTTGFFTGTVDFDPGAGVYELISNGAEDIFVSKLDSSGAFIWARNLGGTSTDTGESLAIDGSGNVYTTGRFSGTADFDPGAGVANLTSAGLEDIFVSKLDSDGNFVWAKSMGGAAPSYAHGWDIGVDGSGNVYTTGNFTQTVDFDPGPSVSTLTSIAETDIFVSKLSGDGNFIWAKGFGGIWFDSGASLAFESSGSVYITGYFHSNVDFDPGPGTNQLTSAGSTDIFVSKLDSNGQLIWAKSMGGTSGDDGDSIEVDGNGNVYITGYFSEMADLDPGANTLTFTSKGSYDIFVSKLDNAGNLIWARSMGGPGPDYGFSISIDDVGNVYFIGSFQYTVDFDPGAGTTNLTSVDSLDIYINSLDSNGNFVKAKSMGGIQSDFGNDIAEDSDGNVYITGSFRDTVDFDPGIKTRTLTSAGEQDIFVSKLIIATFSDVFVEHPYWQEIETLYANGYTGGCSTSPLLFCPEVIMNRAQAAVFMVRGNFGSNYVPVTPTHLFGDNWINVAWAEGWAESMYLEGLSGGCSVSPRLFCPEELFTNVQAAVFALRMKYGVNYQPPAATGMVFADLTDVNFWGIKWAEQAYAEGLLPACGTSGGKPLFCPDNLVSRGFGASIIVNAKGLVMP